LKPFRKVTIIGVGLIGGSLALALKQRRPKVTVIGFDRVEVMREALQRGAIDEAAPDLLSAVVQADCLILATPISTTLDLLRSIGKLLTPETIVSDICSVKGVVVQAARRYLPGNVLFVGGHPMAGSERSGIVAADPLLFENAYYVLCPPENALRGKTPQREKLASFVKLIESTGARVVFLDPFVHDRIAGTVSHLPQLLAVGLTNLARKSDASALRLAAGGFRDLTRIASSPYDIWDDILRENRKEISRTLDRMIKKLKQYKTLIDSKQLSKLRKEFSQARETREEIPKEMKGFHHPLVDVFVSLKDKPGELSKLTKALARRNINIKDIELLKVREGERGNFRVAFENHKVADRALKVIRAAGFEAHQ